MVSGGGKVVIDVVTTRRGCGTLVVDTTNSWRFSLFSKSVNLPSQKTREIVWWVWLTSFRYCTYKLTYYVWLGVACATLR